MATAQQSCHLYHGVLEISKFATNPQGQDIPTKLRQQQQWSALSKVKGTLGKELPTNLNYLMGNDVTKPIFDINGTVQHLAHRNYPEAFAQDGSICGKIQICIPEIYLMGKNSVKFVDIARKIVKVPKNLFSKVGELFNIGKLIGRRENVDDDTILEQIPEQCIGQDNELLGMHRGLSGDIIEKEFFMKIKKILKGANEQFALFHGHDLFKFDLNDRGNRLVEKDFILVNYTHRYVCGVEVKRTLSGPSISSNGKPIKGTIASSADQLKGAKASLESWFSTELGNHWDFFSMVYCHTIDPTESICQQCSKHIMIGMFKIIMKQKILKISTHSLNF